MHRSPDCPSTIGACPLHVCPDVNASRNANVVLAIGSRHVHVVELVLARQSHGTRVAQTPLRAADDPAHRLDVTHGVFCSQSANALPRPGETIGHRAGRHVRLAVARNRANAAGRHWIQKNARVIRRARRHLIANLSKFVRLGGRRHSTAGSTHAARTIPAGAARSAGRR